MSNVNYKKKGTKRRNKKNRLISYFAVFIWVVLLGGCIGIYFYNHNKPKSESVITASDKVAENNKQSTENKTANDNNSNVDDDKSTQNENKDAEVIIDEDKNKDKNQDKENDTNNTEEINNESNNELDNKDVNVDKQLEKDKDSTDSTENNTEKSSNTKESTATKKNESTTIKNEDLYANVEKVTFNSENRVIVIDPGHADHSNLEKEPISPGSSTMKIKDGGGTSGQFSGTPEYIVAMGVSVKLKPLLEEKGFTVIMTKTEHDVSLGNVERAEIGNEANAALVIRVHADGAANVKAHGASMLVPDLNEYTAAVYDESKRCGKIVIDTLAEEVGMYNRGLVFRKDITGFNWSKVPVVLVEMGFMTNENEDKLLNDSEYQDKLAKGLADGIEKALTP